MEQIIKDLFPLNRCLLGEGYDNALEYIKHLIDLEVIEIPSGTKLETWTVPDEWIVRDAWVKFNGKKIIDYKKNPLSLMVYSAPFKGKVSEKELTKHLYTSEEMPTQTPYTYSFYEREWGFGVPEKKKKLKKGKYEVFIDTEFRPGTMKLGVHTIKGESDREILLFAHLDHPFQANDNLSGVACLIDLATRLKSDRTIKIIFCPETIGSIAYGVTQDLTKVDFVIAVDICGNDNTILLQKSFDNFNRLNRVAHCAMQVISRPYRKGVFRSSIGSDEYYFNDPLVNIPGLLISRHPYKEYHTDLDTPDKIDYTMIKETQEVITKIIEIWDKDYIPKRKYKGPLMRSRFGIQTPSKQVNLNYDYLFYFIDGEKYLSELCGELEFNFDYIYAIFEKLKSEQIICVSNSCEEGLKEIAQ